MINQGDQGANDFRIVNQICVRQRKGWERFTFVGDGQGCSFALKGQYIPARRIAAGSITQEINAL